METSSPTPDAHGDHVTVPVQLFARARDLAGQEFVTLRIPSGGNVANLRQALIVACPALGPLAARLHVAINNEYVADAAAVNADATVACFPPVSGG